MSIMARGDKMTNDAWRKLLNEWDVNKCNEDCIDTCLKHGVDINADNVNSMDMIGIRKVCKVKGVWLENKDEEWIYLELMPFGGYRGNLKTIKAALSEYRKAETKFAMVDYLVDKYCGR